MSDSQEVFDLKMENVRELKERAYNLGKDNKCLFRKDLKSYHKSGFLAEFGMLAMLGRIERLFKNSYNETFTIDLSADADKKGIDIKINGIDINFKSRFINQDTMPGWEQDPKVIILVLNKSGIYNLSLLLKKINMLHYIPDKSVSDLNYIWETYMNLSAIGIEMMNYKNIENDNSIFNINPSIFSDEDLIVLNKEKEKFGKMVASASARNSEITVNSFVDIKAYTLYEVADYIGMGYSALYYFVKQHTLGFCKKDDSKKSPILFTTEQYKRFVQFCLDNKNKIEITGRPTIIRTVQDLYQNNKFDFLFKSDNNTSSSPIEPTINKYSRKERKNIIETFFSNNNWNEDNIISSFDLNNVQLSEEEENVFKIFNYDPVEIIGFMYPLLTINLDTVAYNKEIKRLELIDYVGYFKSMISLDNAKKINLKGVEGLFFKGVLDLHPFNGSLYNLVKECYPEIKKYELINRTEKDYGVDDAEELFNDLINNSDNGQLINIIKTLSKLKNQSIEMNTVKEEQASA